MALRCNLNTEKHFLENIIVITKNNIAKVIEIITGNYKRESNIDNQL